MRFLFTSSWWRWICISRTYRIIFSHHTFSIQYHIASICKVLQHPPTWASVDRLLIHPILHWDSRRRECGQLDWPHFDMEAGLQRNPPYSYFASSAIGTTHTGWRLFNCHVWGSLKLKTTASREGWLIFLHLLAASTGKSCGLGGGLQHTISSLAGLETIVQ